MQTKVLQVRDISKGWCDATHGKSLLIYFLTLNLVSNLGTYSHLAKVVGNLSRQMVTP